MDDATIVRTLAEFEGIVDPRYDKWFGSQAFYAVNMTPLKVPDYLTDFNAIVRIWRKLPHQTRIAAWSEMFYVEYWYEATPRQHALALATAIAKHKETGNE